MSDAPHRPRTYADLIEDALRTHPQRVAFAHGERRITYGEAHALVARMRAVLADAGLRPGDGVAILARNRPDAFLAIAAALTLGCRYTALHPMGSRDDHAYVLAHSQARALLYDGDAFDDHVAALLGEVEVEQAWSLAGGASGRDLTASAQAASPRPPHASELSDLAFLAYTGGTTGRPKGVMLAHRCLAEMVKLELAAFDLPEQVRFLGCAPISHATGLFVVPTLLRGGTVHLHEGFDVAAFLETVARERISATFLVPSMIYRLLDSPLLDGADLSSLETVVYGASPMSPPRMAEAQRRVGPVFLQLYGQAEAPQALSVLAKRDHVPERLASCGLPVPGVEVRVLDADGREAPVGEVGEVCARGPLVMDGYWRDTGQTAQALRGGWLHTGDLARRDADGFLAIVDRSKDMVISGGFNVYPREVEDVLASHPGVREAAVIGVPDASWGEAVLAFVVAAPGAAPDADELKALVRERKGPVYAPKQVRVVDALPLTAVGKPDKKALRAAFWADAERAVG